MDREECWQAVADSRCAIADVLDELSDEEWNRPSLCEGWRVRDVAAHVAMGANPPGIVFGLKWAVRTRGRFHVMNHDMAVDHSARPTAEITAELREHAASRKVAIPGLVDHRVTLTDVAVHGFDIALPLDKAYSVPAGAAAFAADFVWTTGWPFFARRRLKGFRLKATDADWTAGDGELVEAPIGSLLLVVTGRQAGLEHVGGPGADALANRMRR